jgi:hypothetical protein
LIQVEKVNFFSDVGTVVCLVKYELAIIISLVKLCRII